MTDTLGAIITAIVTPFDQAGDVDEEGFVELLAHLAANGSDGFVICGTTGEAATLSVEEHLRLIELAVAERPAGTTIIAGAGSNDTRHAVEMSEKATELGADALLSVTPYYNRPNERGIKAHYERIIEATNLPIVLYNIPSRTGTNLSNEFVAELAQLERIDYLKQANPADVKQIDGLGLYAGNDDMLAEVLDLGGLGGILVASHLVGPQMRQMVEEPARRAELHEQLTEIFDAMGVTTNPIPVKAGLTLMGLPAGPLRLPLVEASSEERAAVAAALSRLGLA
ncbi:MAG: 4-hydroxy-tetrahydrodipicolinate synthase [Actinobacteria bacterium]|uniref:4-hydroxy-tetrahydrodipicolinate synthase n=1 Tax=freshwater metagenome TaxID=449393 RepID=A0A6J5Z6F3_9ZZZZ|nr:4-hydroxy-tetrahydrodipicolinate synthase [Actinomycetota bacterium]